MAFGRHLWLWRWLLLLLLGSTGRGRFPRPAAVLVGPFIEVDELLVTDKEIPATKRLAATSPTTGKWLFFGMRSLMSLNMLYTPESLTTVLAWQGFGFLWPALYYVLVGSPWNDRALYGRDGLHIEIDARIGVRTISLYDLWGVVWKEVTQYKEWGGGGLEEGNKGLGGSRKEERLFFAGGQFEDGFMNQAASISRPVVSSAL